MALIWKALKEKHPLWRGKLQKEAIVQARLAELDATYSGNPAFGDEMASSSGNEKD